MTTIVAPPVIATATLSAIVTRLGQGLGLTVEEDDVQRRVEETDVAAAPLLRVEIAARAVGLRAARLIASTSSLQPRRGAFPLVAVGSLGGLSGLVIVAALRRRGLRRVFEVLDVDGEERQLTPQQLAGRLGLSSDQPGEWLTVELPLPMHSIGGSPGRRPSPQQRVAALLRLERRDLLVVVVYGAVVGLLSLATPLAVQALVSTVAFGNLLQPLIVLSAIVILVLLAGGLLRTLQLYVVEILQRRLFARLVADLAWRLPRVAFGERDTTDGSKLVNRFFDVITVQKSSATLLLDGVVLTLELVVGLTVLAVYSNVLLVFALALLLAVFFIVFVLGRTGIRTSVAESYAKHDVAGWLEDLVRHPTAFRTAAGRHLGVSRAEALTRSYLRARIAHFRIVLRQSVAAYGLQALASASLLGVGGALVMGGQLTLGQLVAAELILGTIVASFAKLSKQLEAAYDLFAAIDKIGHLIDLPVERAHGSAVRQRPLGLAVHELQLDVGGRTLHLGSLSIKAGEHVAIVGASGSGKSAFVDAVLGLRDSTTGRISVDGDDVRSLSLEALRGRIGVARDVEIFEGTVTENLRIGRGGILSRDMVEVLRIVELGDDILDRSPGLSLGLVPGGTMLSSGQARRLMIARALLGQPGLVIIDSSLDGLDDEMARRILARIRRRLSDEGGTLIVTTANMAFGRVLPRALQLSSTGLTAVKARSDPQEDG